MTFIVNGSEVRVILFGDEYFFSVGDGLDEAIVATVDDTVDSAVVGTDGDVIGDVFGDTVGDESEGFVSAFIS